MAHRLEVDAHSRNGYPRPVVIPRHPEVLGENAPEATVCPHRIGVIVTGNDEGVEHDEDRKHGKCQPAFLLLYLEDIE